MRGDNVRGASSVVAAGHLAPLFWHAGEPEDAVVSEIDAMRRAGIHQFVVEPRPHPDYLGPQWWADLGVVVEAAAHRGMRVWLFDDARFPSGWVNGALTRERPDLRKRFLAVRAIDPRGPVHGAAFRVSAWLGPDERLLAVAAARRCDDDVLEAATLTDLTGLVDDGLLLWDVPDGPWRIVLLIETGTGGEPATADYLDPLAEGAAAFHLSRVHEAHFDHFGADFGTTIAGFFQDEPRFGNAASYELRLGAGSLPDRTSDFLTTLPVLPWWPGGRAAVRSRIPSQGAAAAALLWFDADDDDLTASVRFDYMDAVTRRYGAFQAELGAWCDDHGVGLIGHLIEDNGAHARLGYGTGHYFRAIAGQTAAGLDVVNQIRPRHETGRTSTSHFGYLRDEFFFWGVAKLASSAAHLDSRLGGVALAEAFGAYGWHEGLRLMKWLTDHLAVRGVNALVPHAFSPTVWNPDCPPHFVNGGLNPQWRHHPVWVAYAEDVLGRLTGGQHVCDVAVIYPAESEWAGAAMPVEQVVRVLAQQQLDADIVPRDAVLSAVVVDGALMISDEAYGAIVVPSARWIPADLARRLCELAEQGVPVLVVDAAPLVLGDADTAARLAAVTTASTLDRLAEAVAERIEPDVVLDRPAPSLRVYHYRRGDAERWFVVNESIDDVAEVELTVRASDAGRVLEVLDPAIGLRWTPPVVRSGTALTVAVRLEPYESRFLELVLRETPAVAEADVPTVREVDRCASNGWTVTARRFDSDEFVATTIDDLGPVGVPSRLPRFGGTVRYERAVDWPAASAFVDVGGAGETVEAWLGNHWLGVRICPPYRFPLSGLQPSGMLRIEVTTTLARAAEDSTFDRDVALEPAGLLGPVTVWGHVDE